MLCVSSPARERRAPPSVRQLGVQGVLLPRPLSASFLDEMVTVNWNRSTSPGKSSHEGHSRGRTTNLFIVSGHYLALSPGTALLCDATLRFGG